MKNKDILKTFKNEGSIIIDKILNKKKITEFNNELKKSINKDVNFHKTKNYKYYGYVLCNAKYGGPFLKIFNNNKLNRITNLLMGKNCILYSYTSSSMPPHKGNDSSKIHVDCPMFNKDFVFRMGVLIALTDFTKENGATLYLPRSHLLKKKPSKNEFYKRSKLLKIKSGSAWFFNSRLWHSGGVNKTNKWRHALTLNICHPWMKQRIDLTKIIKKKDLKNVSFVNKKKFGFFSIPPKSYSEYYNNKKRFFL